MNSSQQFIRVVFSRPIGDIQIGMMEKKGQLEVEVIRARGLVQKPGSKSLPGENQKGYFLILIQQIRIQRKTTTTKKKNGATNLPESVSPSEKYSAEKSDLDCSGRPLRLSLMAFFIVLFLPPAPYVKVYLLNNGAYVAKKKTKIARKTLDPLYQQALLFEESPQGKVLQVRPTYISPFLPGQLF